jgi:hypothetical protein
VYSGGVERRPWRRIMVGEPVGLREVWGSRGWSWSLGEVISGYGMRGL